jgi:CBS domain containing-hemolysin-like protein
MSHSPLVILVCLLLSAFFSGMEIAFVSSNRIRLAIQKKQGGVMTIALSKLTDNPSKFIATMLVGNNVALVVYGIFMGHYIIDLLHSDLANLDELPLSIVFEQTLISTAVILITAEFFPKVVFQIYANSLLQFFAIPAIVFYHILSPLTNGFLWFSNTLLLKFFKVGEDQNPTAFTRVELEEYVSEHVGSAQEEELENEIQIFHNALAFTDRKAREVMVPRAEITAVDRYTPLKDLTDLFSKTGYSKILVFNSGVDHIVGYVHAFDLFKKPKTTRSIIHPVEFVPESMYIKDVLNALIKKRKSMAVVLDEYGGTAGMMTIEDIVEELFGEIEDEYDQIDLIEHQQDDGSFVFSARLEIDYINETYDLHFQTSDQYETLGGYIVHHTENIPEQGAVFAIEQCDFEIAEVSNTKIELVRVKLQNA